MVQQFPQRQMIGPQAKLSQPVTLENSQVAFTILLNLLPKDYGEKVSKITGICRVVRRL